MKHQMIKRFPLLALILIAGTTRAANIKTCLDNVIYDANKNFAGGNEFSNNCYTADDQQYEPIWNLDRNSIIGCPDAYQKYISDTSNPILALANVKNYCLSIKDSIEKIKQQRMLAKVKMDDSIVHAKQMAQESMIRKRYPKRAKQILNHEVAIGMTYDMVEISIGYPIRSNISQYEWGTEEQWCYSDNFYVYFKNGKVTAINSSE